MSIHLPEITPLPHHAIFKKHKIRKARIAKYLGFCYAHTHNILTGVTEPKPEIREKLDALVDQLEGRV